VRIAFVAGQTQCVFTRNHFWGNARLQAGNQSTTLQSLLNPGTYVGVKMLRTWERRVDGHTVRIEKRRPLLFAGLRPHAYVVFVDGAVVDTRSVY
jgi:hypothetical protein